MENWLNMDYFILHIGVNVDLSVCSLCTAKQLNQSISNFAQQSEITIEGS